MKCKSCGAETQSKFCEYCGSEMVQEKTSVNIINNYYNGTTQQEHSDNNISSGTNKGSGKKTWLWVLGWIFIFPLPLTILLLRKKDMNPAVKYGIIAVAWILYFIIGISGNSKTNTTLSDIPLHTETDSTTDTYIYNTENNTIIYVED